MKQSWADSSNKNKTQLRYELRHAYKRIAELEAEVERLKKEHAVLVGPSYEDALHAFHELRDFTTGSGRP